MSFLARIADQFLAEYGNDLHRVAFVFPTQRAGLYFSRHLQLKKPPLLNLWAPPVFSMSDFFARLSPLTQADQLDLIFELHYVYKRYIVTVEEYNKSFESFYAWGKMILADFDEIDKYMLDTRKLFRTLKEFKAVEDITREEKAVIYNRYTDFWSVLGIVHREFTRLLREKNKAYEGMIYRDVAENIKTILAREDNGAGGTGEKPFPWDKVIFCGFNALSGAESSVIGYLLEQGTADIYWDADKYFVKDRNQEAGHFFRQNMTRLKIAKPKWIEDRLSTEPKKVRIIGVQSKVSQAKALALELARWETPQMEPENTAVVLPDEPLLFPVLNSIPENVEKINITIGFPLRQTPVASLFLSLIEMYLRVIEGAPAFYYKDILKVLNHPYIKPMTTDELPAFQEDIHAGNRVHIHKEQIPLVGKDPFDDLFTEKKRAGGLLIFFLDLLDYIRTYYQESEHDIRTVDYEFIYHFYTLISRMKESLDSTGLDPELREFRTLFTDIVMNSRIPFTGEPLVGLQIMGIQETQALDFADLFILSVNEGYFPPGKGQLSFIPSDIRAQLGLPTYKDRDALVAYHFYRLLKNSRNTTLFYVTEAKGMEKGEKSRFIEQLLIEYGERNRDAEITHLVMDFPFESRPARPISIPKTKKITDDLLKIRYSPSSLLTYLTCPYKFYLTYMQKLFEEDEVMEHPDYIMFGHIAHETLRSLYNAAKENNRVVDEQELKRIESRLERTLTKVYRNWLKSDDLTTGRNRIIYEVLYELLKSFLHKEKKECGFRVLLLEAKMPGTKMTFQPRGGGEFLAVTLRGTIDRLDVKDGVYRIIDYKTGAVGTLGLESIDLLGGEKANKFKEAFQLLFYRFLLSRDFNYKQYAGEFNLGVYPLKTLQDKLEYVSIAKSKVITPDLMDEFAEVLADIFRELFDPEIPFTQTEDEKNCEKCPYVNICGREPVERRY